MTRAQLLQTIADAKRSCEEMERTFGPDAFKVAVLRMPTTSDISGV